MTVMALAEFPIGHIRTILVLDRHGAPVRRGFAGPNSDRVTEMAAEWEASEARAAEGSS